MLTQQIILGLDPGLADTGWGIIVKDQSLRLVACGSLKTASGQPLDLRLAELRRQLLEILELYQPQLVAIEELFFNTNTTTAIAVAEARGVLLATIGEQKLAWLEFTPLEIKQALTTSGRAAKPQVGRMVMKLLKLTALPKPDDAVDALACAICASFQSPLIKAYV